MSQAEWALVHFSEDWTKLKIRSEITPTSLEAGSVNLHYKNQLNYYFDSHMCASICLSVWLKAPKLCVQSKIVYAKSCHKFHWGFIVTLFWNYADY